MSDDAFQALVDAAAREGVSRHAAWDPARYGLLCEGPARTLWERLRTEPHRSDPTVVAAYLALLREAVGARYLGKAAVADAAGEALGPWACFLEYELLKLVPDALVDEPSEDRVALLARAWNLGEGLLGEPAWLDRYVVAYAGALRRVGEVEAFLVRVLGPVLEPTPPASWSGPFALSVLDTRAVHDPFLPGEMHLAAPAVLCVRDRRDPEVHLNVLLRHGDESRVLGLSPPLGEYVQEGPVPEVAFADGEVRIAGHRVDVPLLGAPYRVATAGAGFVVASAPDSQRLWIVESP